MGNLQIRRDIQDYENAIKRSLTPIDIEIKHYFAKGLYAREAYIPKGVCCTGKIHRHSHINIISKGVILVVTESGKQRIEAPFTMVSEPGTKRAGYALEDTIWTTIHATKEGMTDLDELERYLITDSYEGLECPGSLLLD